MGNTFGAIIIKAAIPCYRPCHRQARAISLLCITELQSPKSIKHY